jgi:ribonuclease HI
MVNCITINTDASFHSEKKVGGYAFYIVCDLFKIQKGGKFKVSPKSSMDAEMMCMANALHTLFSQKELPTAKLIVINSDCLFSFEKIGLKKQNEIGRKVAQTLRLVRKRMASYGGIYPAYEFRHVKAHSGVKNARSWVNEWCDTEAKKWMRLSLNDTKNNS